jgi:cytochrome c oxidase cbb3-type subunit 3
MRVVPFLVLFFFVSACRHPDFADAAPPDGIALFGQTCARCHGRDGTGDPVAKAQLGVPDMTDPTWQHQHSDDDIRRTVHEGSKSKKMPPFGNLYSPAQLDAITVRVRSFAR